MRELTLYNSLTNKVEVFRPNDPEHIKMYVCGPTVYDSPHVGNARPAVVFDVLFRVLKHIYPKVTYVRNITDIDDKINNRAKELSISIRELTDQTFKDYQENMFKLGLFEPTHQPRATDNIDHMIYITQRLIEKGHAYYAEKHVLFDVKSDKHYGILSNRTLDEMLAGARVEVAPFKKNPLDFVLWKPSDSEEVGFESPWGFGRPGWHIECSAMSDRYLQDKFDIHGGGQDLIFPHHENELAQSRCFSDNLNMANYWVHNGMLLVDGRKMSKSLGNVVSVTDALESYSGHVLKFFILSTHYSKTLDWTATGLKQAQTTIERLHNSVKDYLADFEKLDFASSPDDEIIKALCDNLNTPKVFSLMSELAKKVNKEIDIKEKTAHALINAMSFMGVLDKNYFNHAQNGINEQDYSLIKQLIQQRSIAKKQKLFEKSDQIRSRLEQEFHVILEDKPNGVTDWHFKK